MFTLYKFTFHISWRKSNELIEIVMIYIYEIQCFRFLKTCLHFISLLFIFRGGNVMNL